MNDQKDKHHIIPLSLYFKVFGALMVLTALTVLVAQVDLGFFNIINCFFDYITIFDHNYNHIW